MMKKLGAFVTNPLVLLTSMIISAVGVVLALGNLVLQIISLIIVSLCFLVWLIAAVKYFFDVKKVKKSLLENFSESMVSAINGCSELVSRIVETSLRAKNDSMDDNSYVDSCRNICREIQTALKKISDIEFSVCIKEICSRELVNYDFLKGHTKTIVRVGKDSEERSKNDHQKQKISDNTSFEYILSTNEATWNATNLEELITKYALEGKQYKNPDKDYHKYYKSTIVVPVRVKGRYISPTIKEFSDQPIENDRPNCIAFLCVDSPLKFDLEDQNFTKAVHFLIICGKALYPIFESKLVNEITKIGDREEG